MFISLYASFWEKSREVDVVLKFVYKLNGWILGKVELSEVAGDLIDMLKARGVEKDGCVAIMLVLKTEDNFRTMLDWLHNNEGANSEDIFEKLQEIV